MPNYLQLPDGSYFTVPDGVDPDMGMAMAKDKYPEAFVPPESGFKAAIGSGIRKLQGAGELGLAGLGFKSNEEAEAARARLEQEDRAKYKSASKGWSETPWEAFKETAGESLPFMAAPVVAGGAAALFGAPALAATGAAGLASAAQFTLTNADRQVNEDKKIADIDWKSAGLAAVPQAALDMIGLRMIPGVRQILQLAGKEVTEAAAKRIATQNLKQVAADYAASTGKAMGAEGLTEAAQQVLERMQAGLNLTDEKARKEYVDSLIGGVVLGGAMSPAGRFVERSGEKSKQEAEVRKTTQEATAKAQQDAEAADEQRKLDPDYIKQLGERNKAYATTVKKLEEAAAVKVEPGDLIGAAQKKAAVQELHDFKNSEDTQALKNEFAEALPLLRAAEAEATAKKAAEDKATADAAAAVDAENKRQRTPQEVLQLQKQLDTAQTALNEATAAAKAAARSGDEAAHTAAQTAISTQKAVIAELNGKIPPPPAPLTLETNPALASLKRTLQGRIRAYDGAVNDEAAAASIFAEIKALKAKIAATEQNKAELVARQGDLTSQRTTGIAEDQTAQMLADQEALARGTPKTPTDMKPPEQQSQGDMFGGTGSKGASQVVSNVGEAPSRAKLMADAVIARSTGNFAKAEEIKQQISDMSNRERQRERDPSWTDKPTVNRLVAALGMDLPKSASDISKHSDAIDIAYAKMVSLLERSNRGRLNSSALYAARDTIVQRMIADVASKQGGITPEERSNISRQTNAVLRELINRFGDTRNIVTDNKGRPEDVQNADGTYKDDLLEPGQYGRINEESAAPGRQTFGNPHAAVEALRGQLTDIRNEQLKGPAPAAPLTPAETRARSIKERTDTLPDDGRIRAIRDNMEAIAADPERSNTVHDWLDTKDVPNNSNALDHPGESIPRGTQVKGNVSDSVGYAKQRLDDMLRTLEEGKRSETEGGRTAQQGDLLDNVPMKEQTTATPEGFSRERESDVPPVTRGKIFDTPEKLVAHLESDKLQGLRDKLGLQIPTVQRIIKLMEPLQKKLAALHMELEQLSLQQAGIPDLQQRKTRMHAQLMDLQREVITHTEELLKQEQLIKDTADTAAEASYAIAENDPAAKLKAEVKTANQAVLDAQIALDKARDVYLTADKGMPETKEQAKARDLARSAKENWQNAENEAVRLSYPPERGESELAPAHQKRVNEQRAAYEKAKAHAEFLRKHMARMQGQYTRKMQDPTRSMEHSNRWQLSLLALKDATGVLQRALRKQASVHAKTEDAVLSSDKAINEWATKHDKLQAVLLHATEARARAERARSASQASIDAIRKLQEEVAAGETNRGSTPIDAENARRAVAREELAAEARTKQEEAVTTARELGNLEEQNSPAAREAERVRREEALRREEAASQENITTREEQDRAQRKAENDMAERLAKLPGEEINHEAFREAQALVGTPEEYAAVVAKLEAKKTEAGISEDTKNKIDRALAKLRRDKKYLDGAAEGDQGARLAATTELSKLTTPWTSQKGVQHEGRISELQRQLADAEAAGATKKQLGNIRKELTKANKRAKELTAILKGYNARADRISTAEKQVQHAAARKFLLDQTRETFEERGTLQGDAPVRGADGRFIEPAPWEEGGRPALRRGEVSQASKREVLAGDQRSGTAESMAGENKVSNANPVQETRKIEETNRPISKKEMQEANVLADAIKPAEAAQPASDLVAHKLTADKAVVHQNEEVATIERKLNTARTHVEEAEDAAIPLPYEKMTALLERQKYLENKLAHAKEMRELALSRQRLAEREVSPPVAEKPTEPQASKEDANDALYDKEIEAYDNQPDDLFVGESEASDIDSGVVFRTSEEGKRGMPIADVQRTVEERTKGWTNMPEVKYVQSETDLPLRLQGSITKINENGNVPGMLDARSGTVWMVGDNIKSTQDAVLTILHEAAGHHGLRDMLGAAYESTMNRLYNGNAEVKRMADAKLEKNPDLTREVAVEEVLADAAEKAPESRMVKQIIYAIKTFLHKHFGYGKVSDADVLQLVANARRHTEKGTPGPTRGNKASTVQMLQALDKRGTGTLHRTSAKEADYGKYAGGAMSQLNTGREDTRGWYQRWTDNLGLSLETGLVDMHAPIMRALEAAGNTKDTMQAKYALREVGASAGWVQSFLSHGAPELFKDAKGFNGIRASKGAPSGLDVLAAAEAIPGGNTEGKFQMATRYLLMKRGSRVGADKLGSGITQANLDAIRAEVNADPALKAALENFHKIYNQYNEKLVHFARDTGGITSEKAKEFLQHGDYVPMYRVKDGQLELSFGDSGYVKMGDIANTPFIHALKGGTSQIMPINESIIYNTKLLVDVGMVNLAKRNIGYVLSAAGRKTAANGKSRMVRRDGVAPAGKEYLQWQEEPRAGEEPGEHAGMRYIKIDTEGTVMEGIPSEVLGQSIEGFHATMPAFVSWAAKLNDILRAGVTRVPPYTLRQLLKDPMSVASTSGLATNPLTTVKRAMTEYGKGTFGDKTALEEANRHALVQSNIFTGDVDDMLKLTHQIAAGNKPNLVRAFLNQLDRSAHTADAATRILVYKDSIARGLSEVEAAYRTRESMNYHKRGAWASIQFANRLLPFFNSGTQALNVAVKAVQGKMPFEEALKIRQTYVRNALMLATGGMAYAALMQDNDEYKKLKPADRYGNFHVALPGTTLLLKLPVAYAEGGGMAWAIGQALVDGLGDTHEAKQIIKGLAAYGHAAIPGGGTLPIPTGLKQSIEWATNTDLRTYQPIVGAGLEGSTRGEQYDAYTPETIKALGLVGISPKQFGHALDGITGSAASSVLNMLEGLIGVDSDKNADKPSLTLDRMPLIKSFIQNPRSDAATEVVYELAMKAKAAHATYERLKREGRSREYIKNYYDENRAEIAMATTAGGFTQQMGKLNADIKVITNAPRGTYSAERKTEAIERLIKQKATIAERYMAAVKRIEQQTRANA